MRERVLTAIALIAAFLYGILLNPMVLKILIVLIILIASYEVVGPRKKDSNLWLSLPIIGFVLAAGLLPNSFFLVLLGLLIILLFTVSVFDVRFTYDHVTYYATMTAMLMIAHLSVVEILNQGSLVFLYVLIATYATDTFALFGGKFFGKRKLIERISPKKTVEGAIVGYVSSVILSISFGFIFMDTFDKSIIISASFLIPFFSQIGDLAFSLIKRHYGIKDFGNVFPGHGGVLDRIDSLIFSLIIFMGVMQAIALI